MKATADPKVKEGLANLYISGCKYFLSTFCEPKTSGFCDAGRSEAAKLTALKAAKEFCHEFQSLTPASFKTNLYHYKLVDKIVAEADDDADLTPDQ
jgi:hypothetical protein